ncbi:GIDE domain-containing protein [Halolamina sp. C58]|uniref:GIDE domain-containing protein n=1 Tax=Halolamina sp. C58 TaxID=3421640 RepID=UPI003EBC4BFD
MPPLWPAAFLLVGVLVWLGAAPAPLTGLRLLRTPDRPVSDLLSDRPDSACFTGTVVETEDGGTVEAPFSGHPAVAMAYQVLEEESSALWWLFGFTLWRPTSFEPIDGGAVANSFLLDDGSGQVRVDPSGATFRLEPDTVIGVKGGDTPPERIRRYIDANEDIDDEDVSLNLGIVDWGVGTDRRYVERRLEPGDEVLVCGAARDARGAVGAVQATIDSGRPFLLADADRRTLARRLLVGSPAAVLLSLALVAGGGLAYAGFFGLL